MIKLIYRYILPLVILLVAGIVGYNLWFGTDEEKENSRRILAQIKGLGGSVVGLLKDEKEKFDQGKYDKAMENIGDAMATVKEQAVKLADGGKEVLGKVNALEREKADLQAQLDDLAAKEAADPGSTAAESADLQSKITNLANETEQLSVQLANE